MMFGLGISMDAAAPDRELFRDSVEIAEAHRILDEAGVPRVIAGETALLSERIAYLRGERDIARAAVTAAPEKQVVYVYKGKKS